MGSPDASLQADSTVKDGTKRVAIAKKRSTAPASDKESSGAAKGSTGTRGRKASKKKPVAKMTTSEQAMDFSPVAAIDKTQTQPGKTKTSTGTGPPINQLCRISIIKLSFP